MLEGAKDAERKSTLLRGRDGQMHAIQEYISVGVESGLKRIKIPTLIITGDCDRVVPPINSDLLHQTIKGSRKIVLSHTIFFKESLAAEKKTTSKNVKNIQSKVEKSTLGDIDALAALKSKLEKGEK